MFKGKRFPAPIKQLLYTLSFFTIWAVVCVPKIWLEDETRFQAAGSLVVAYTIAILVTRRAAYDRSLALSQEVAVTTALNRIEAHRKISEIRSDNTADLHAVQLVQISNHIGVPCPIGPQNETELRELGQDLEKRLAAESFPPPKEDQAFVKAIDQLKEKRTALETWVSFMWKLEVFFLVFGTLQWGYGDQWLIYARALGRN